MSRSKKKAPEDLVTIPFDALVLAHGEIGVHRGRKYGFRDVFGFRTLSGVPFLKLAKKVKAAYDGTDVPSHKGWPKQHETLKWFVEKGLGAMYDFKDDILVYKHDEIYALAEGNHRALALYLMGADSIRAAVVKRKSSRSWTRRIFDSGSVRFRS